MAVSIIAAALAAGTAIYGAVQKDKAAKAARNNVRPQYEIPQTEYDNLNLLENNAGHGMSDMSKQYLLNNADRGLAASIGAIQRSGGNSNAMSGLYDNYFNNVGSIAVQDDKRKYENMMNLIQQRQRMGNAKDKEWQINDYAPWQDRAAAYAQQQAAGQQTMMSGINSFGGAMGNFASGMKGSHMGDTSRGSTTPEQNLSGFGAWAQNNPGPSSSNPYMPDNISTSMPYDGPDYMQLNSMGSDEKHNLYNNWLQYGNVA